MNDGPCFVDAMGQLICAVDMATAGEFSSVGLKKVLGPVSEAKLRLIESLINEVLKAPIPDKSIKIRSSDIVASAHILLDEPPPVMIAYRYVKLPGNILATYYMQQKEFDTARVALDEWEKPRAAF